MLSVGLQSVIVVLIGSESKTTDSAEDIVKKRWELDYELDSFHGLYEGRTLLYFPVC